MACGSQFTASECLSHKPWLASSALSPGCLDQDSHGPIDVEDPKKACEVTQDSHGCPRWSLGHGQGSGWGEIDKGQTAKKHGRPARRTKSDAIGL